MRLGNCFAVTWSLKMRRLDACEVSAFADPTHGALIRSMVRTPFSDFLRPAFLNCKVHGRCEWARAFNASRINNWKWSDRISKFEAQAKTGWISVCRSSPRVPVNDFPRRKW